MKNKVSMAEFDIVLITSYMHFLHLNQQHCITQTCIEKDKQRLSVCVENQTMDLLHSAELIESDQFHRKKSKPKRH